MILTNDISFFPDYIFIWSILFIMTDTTFLEKLDQIARDPLLSIFLEESYSFELLVRLLKTEGVHGIENLYSLLVSGKPKQPAFDRYLKRLEENGLVHKDRSKDKRVWSIYLTDLCLQKLHFSKITFRDMSPFIIKSIEQDFAKNN